MYKGTGGIIFFMCITAIVACLFFPSVASCLEQQGKDAGTTSGNFIKSQLGDEGAIDSKLYSPLTQDGVLLQTFDGVKTGSATTFCGQGEVQEEKKALQVTLGTNSVSVSMDTNNDGVLDSTRNFSVTKVCIDGYAVGTPPAASYYQWSVNASGVVSSVVTGTLNGCMDVDANPPTYAGGAISKKYAEATGKIITNSSFTSNVATYYAGTVKDCSEVQKDISETKYYDNPYTMNDAAIQQTLSCTLGDPSCEAYTGLKAGALNVTGTSSSTASCTITRNIINAKGPQNGVICESQSLYYPNGYSEGSSICYKTPGSSWEYNSKFVARCDSYGKELTLEAWAFYEGAPCGVNANYPPDNQIEYPMTYGGSSSNVLIGKLDVNYRIAGTNTAQNDLDGDVRCYSDVYPLNTHLSHTCAGGNSYCTYTINIENTPYCNNFTLTITPPVGENIDDQCDTYEQRSCNLIDEWWYNATGGKVQTLKNGSSTNNFPEETCKNFSLVGTVCKEWWRKDRIYDCGSESTKYTPDIARATAVAVTADNMDSDSIKYQQSFLNKENTPTCIVKVEFALGSFENMSECLSMGGKIYCPREYLYSAPSNMCQKQPACSDGLTYDNDDNVCSAPISPYCETPYTYNPGTSSCEAGPLCSNGALNPDTDLCETGITPVCDVGYSYNPDKLLCESSPICSDSTFNPINDLCETEISPTCEEFYIYNSSEQLCEAAPNCTTGVFNTETDLCESEITPSCEVDFVFNSETELCEAFPICKEGTYNAANDRCETPVVIKYECPVDLIQYDDEATCNSNCAQSEDCQPLRITGGGGLTGSYFYGVSTSGNLIRFLNNRDVAIGQIGFLNATVSGGFTGRYYPVSKIVSSGSTLSFYYSSIFLGTINLIDATATGTCDAGYTYIYKINTLNNSFRCLNTAYQNVGTIYLTSTEYTCPLGEYPCSGTPLSCSVSEECKLLEICPEGYSVDEDVCASNAECPLSSFLNPENDRCEMETDLCPPSMTYSEGRELCELDPTCQGSGILNVDRDLCEAGAEFCEAPFTYNEPENNCRKEPLCSRSGTLNIEDDVCESPADLCTSGMTYETVSGMCTEIPSCPGSGLFNGSTDLCEEDAIPCKPGTTYDTVDDRCEDEPTCSNGGTLNIDTDFCEIEAQCTRTDYTELECKYDNPTQKIGLYCAIDEYPLQPNEANRSVFRDCIEEVQCQVSCVILIPDAMEPSGFRTEKRACTESGGTYTCPNGGYTIQKNCDCIIDTWDPEEFQEEECEVSCIIKNAATPEADSNVNYDYYLKKCDVEIIDETEVYTCPAAGGEMIYQDCGCVDGFGLSAGTLGALIDALNDRECID